MACAQCTENKMEDGGCPELISEQKCSERRSCYQTFLRRTVIYRKSIYFVSIVLVLGLADSVSADLIGHWRFDEGSGTVAYDSSGNGHDGTIYGSPSWVPGVVGSALEFDGTDDYVGTGESLLNNMSEFTLACWVSAGNPRSSRIGLIGQNDLIEMGFMGGNAEMWTDRTSTTTTQWNFEDYTWHHITVSGDVTNTKVYLDGELAVTGRGSANYGTSRFPVNIGGGVWDASGNWFLGQIDDVRIYNHALSEIEILTAMKGAGGAWSYALGPEPADGAFHLDTWARLHWAPGSTADSHDVYFGESFTEVNNGTGGTFRGNQTSKYFLVGIPGFPYPEGLVPGTTYYWRIDEVESDGVTKHKGRVWSFYVSSGKAYNPVPSDGAKFVATDVTLTWAAGSGTRQYTQYTVYFGDDFNSVSTAVGGASQTQTRYYPGALEFDKTYYWRVDVFDGESTHKGDIWSFTTKLPYYVDGGNAAARDTNPGTEARPFKTIGKATPLLQPGDTLFIKAGVYREAVILSQSGTKTKPIKIMVYPGDEGKVIINAAEPVTNWRRCTGPSDCAGSPHWNHIYYADVKRLVESHPDSAFAIRQVFQHGELLNRARYPNTGWSYPTSVVDPRTVFSDSSLSKPDGYFTGSVCHIKTEVWQPNQIDIVDYAGHTITLATNPRYDISTRFGYFITNTVGEINEQGEWAYDPARKRLFIWPKNDVAEDIEVTYRKFCIRTYGGVSSNQVRGLSMHNAYESGIWIYQSRDVWIENNTVEHSYDCGIFLQATNGECRDNNIINNTVKYSCSAGIALDRTAYNNNIEGNYVYATGTEYYGGDLMHGRGEGIYISGPFTRVYNNRVDRTGHTSLYLYGTASGREISYNYTTNTCLALSDSGGIYMGGFSDEPETDYIHHNIFEDIFGCRSMEKDFDTGRPPTIETHSGAAPGIYIDGEGNNRIIENNTVINSHMAGIYFHWAPSNVVEKNTLYGNRDAQVWFDGKDEARKILENDDLFENIMFATDAQQKTFYLGINYDNVNFGQSDNNYFYNPYNYRHIHISRYKAYEDRWTRDDLTLGGWRTLSGYDGNSKDFSHLNQFDDITIDSPRKSRIIYNTSLDVINIDLESEKYCDVHGNKIYGSVSLQPFESKILIFSDYEIPDLALEKYLSKGLKIR
jgi:parallel beta-helix repeat protein